MLEHVRKVGSPSAVSSVLKGSQGCWEMRRGCKQDLVTAGLDATRHSGQGVGAAQGGRVELPIGAGMRVRPFE